MGVILTMILSILDTEQPSPSLPTSWDQCLPTRIVGGEVINITDAPFMLMLESGYADSFRFRCGATIISEKVALTASHCSGNPETMRLRSGSSIRGNGTIHYVRKVVDHAVSIDSHYDNDITLLFIKNPFVFSDSVQPLKLPNQELEANTLAMTAGYGSTRPKPGISQFQFPFPPKIGQLRRVIVPVVDNKICHEVVKKKLVDTHNITIPNLITETMVCAGYPQGKKDACEGDSGGPLYHEGTLYGVTSWGVGCALPCSPGIYANVYGFMKWINKTMQENIEE